MAVPVDPPAAFALLVRLDRSRLLDFLAGLTPEQWQLDTPCPGWTVLDLVGHIVGVDLSLISGQRDDHHGTPAPAGLDEAGSHRLARRPRASGSMLRVASAPS